ncbi:MAG: class I SAM-dependent methyltransferase [Dehalococcoidales bacterium]|nr:class I SAM-dependent methyltransferase [Dehalococcoidales bacterium]
MSNMKPKNPHKRKRTPSTNYQAARQIAGRKQAKSLGSPFDDLAKEYDAWYDGEGSLIFANEVQAFQKILPYLPKPWLEIGVGSGRFAQALGIDTGIDPSNELIKIARSRGINASIGRGEELTFNDESYGTVFLIVTLCFLDSPLEALKEANRILMPGGKLVLGLVLKESPWGKLYQQKKDEGHRFYKYAKFYSCREIVRLMFKAGFVGEVMISTLMQKPGDVAVVEEPKDGYYPEAGFTILVGVKRRKKNPTSERL